MSNILIVEDDEKLSKELKIFLEKNGYTAVILQKFDNAVEDISRYKFTIHRWGIYLQRNKKNIKCSNNNGNK